MKKAYFHADIRFDGLCQVIERPLPSSMLTAPEAFLYANEKAILRGLEESRREQRRIAVSRFAAALGVFTAIAMLLTFSREARAFVRDIVYSVIEWISPKGDESGVSFDIESSALPHAPGMQPNNAPDGKADLHVVDEADKLYPSSIYALNGPDFVFSGGYVRNDSLCLEYASGNTEVKLIINPVQDNGDVNYHFNGDDVTQSQTPFGTLYYNLNNGTLFGGMITADSIVTILIPENASGDLLAKVVSALNLQR